VDDQAEKGEWSVQRIARWRVQLIIRGFKALKQMTKMNYLHLDRPEDALKTYRELLGYTKVRSSLGLWSGLTVRAMSRGITPRSRSITSLITSEEKER
jgi:hypothetical protein